MTMSLISAFGAGESSCSLASAMRWEEREKRLGAEVRSLGQVYQACRGSVVGSLKGLMEKQGFFHDLKHRTLGDYASFFCVLLLLFLS